MSRIILQGWKGTNLAAMLWVTFPQPRHRHRQILQRNTCLYLGKGYQTMERLLRNTWMNTHKTVKIVWKNCAVACDCRSDCHFRSSVVSEKKSTVIQIIELESSAWGLLIGVRQTADTATSKKQLCGGYWWRIEILIN